MKVVSRQWSVISISLSAMLFAFCISAAAQQPKKVHRIGILRAGSAPDPFVEAFRQSLRDLGHVEGKSIAIEYRWAEGKNERLPDFAADLVRLKVDVIVAAGPSATHSIKKATTTIPVVMAFDYDPVGSGAVDDLARPGGNITGLSALYPEISGKRLELLKEIVPKLSRLAILGSSTQPGNAQALKEMELAARTLGVQLQYLEVRAPKDIESAFLAATQERADAVLVLTSPVFVSQRTELADLAIKSRVPATYQASEYVEAGGLMSYGVNIADLHRRAATYVDKILKGAKPADLPVEQPQKFELIINLKAAKRIGLTIPPNVLARADRVIK